MTDIPSNLDELKRDPKAAALLKNRELLQSLLSSPDTRRLMELLGRNGGAGWDIGEVPTEGQVRLMLRSLRLPGRITRFIATARYTDRTGVHETSLDGLERKPFVIGVGGQHHIYIELPQ